QFQDISDFHCVTTWSKFDCRWRGVALFTLAEIVKPKPKVRHVLFGSYDGYTTNVRIEDALDDDALVATQFDGKPITRDHGGPARVIIPKLYGWKGAKFVRAIEFLPKISRVSGKFAATAIPPIPGRKTGFPNWRLTIALTSYSYSGVVAAVVGRGSFPWWHACRVLFLGMPSCSRRGCCQ